MVKISYSESAGHHENLILKEDRELCELQCDSTCKMRFTGISLDNFWIYVKDIHRKAIDILSQFTITM